MGNVIFCGDVHLRGNTPKSRCDDYQQNILNKLDFIAEIAEDNSVSHIVFLGDIFDTVNVSISYFSVCLSKFIELSKKFELYTIIGNHDIKYDQLSSVDACPLGILVKAGGIKFINEPLNVGRCKIFGFNWEEDILKCEDNNCYNICLLHKFYQCGFNEEPITPYECLDYNYDLYILGHDHKPYENINLGKCAVARPGSLSRNSGDTYNRLRKPRVLLLDTEKCSTQYIELSKSLPPDRVFLDQQNNIITCLDIVPEMTKAWESCEISPKEFCSEFPEDVKYLILSYLDQIGV